MLADWDPRLITPEQALRMAGDWPVYFTVEWASLSQYGSQQDRWQLNARCGKCEQSCGLLSQGAPGLLTPVLGRVDTSAGDLLSAVLRHMVTAHDWSLSGNVQAAPAEPGPPLVISGPEDHARLIDAITEGEHNG